MVARTYPTLGRTPVGRSGATYTQVVPRPSFPRARRRAALAVLLALGSSLPLLPGLGSAAQAAQAAQAAPTSASTSAAAGRDRSHTPVTRGQAEALLERAKARLHPDAPRNGRRLGHGPSTELTTTLVALSRARSALSGADRQEAERILARPTDGAQGDIAKYGSVRERTPYCPPGSAFCIHYVASGTNAVSLADANGDKVPDYVATVARTMDHVYATEVGRLGYRAPLSDAATAKAGTGNPDDRIDIYLAQLGNAGVYGYCAPEGDPAVSDQLPGYCVLDNNYAYGEYGARNPLLPLQVTAAHEFFHAIQFGYDVNEDLWFMEGTATWVEDEVYDSVNDNLQYLWDSPLRYPSRSVDYSPGLHPYGSWLFFRYAAEFLGDPGVVRAFWEAAEPSGTQNRYSLEAIRSVVAARHSWSDFFLRFGLWNLLPPGTYSERSSYPAPVYRTTRTLTPRSPGTGTVRTDLYHLSSASVRVSPGSTLPRSKRLKVSVNAPSLSRGSAALLLVRRVDGTTSVVPLKLDAAGNTSTTMRFDRRVVRSVTVTVADTDARMRSCWSVAYADGSPAYSCYGRGVTDPTSADRNSYLVSAKAY